jgi:hypothetical protein
MAVPLEKYETEFLAMKKADRRSVEAAEMKFLRHVAGYACKGQIRSDNIRQKLKIINLNDGIRQNKKNRYEHILRMDPRRITLRILQYKPTGHRNIEDTDDVGKMTSETEQDDDDDDDGDDGEEESAHVSAATDDSLFIQELL